MPRRGRQRCVLLTRPALLLLCCASHLRAARCADAFTAQLGPVVTVMQQPPSAAAAAASAAVLRLGAALEPAWAGALTARLATQGASAGTYSCVFARFPFCNASPPSKRNATQV